jgi:hypothetical protein
MIICKGYFNKEIRATEKEIEFWEREIEDFENNDSPDSYGASGERHGVLKFLLRKIEEAKKHLETIKEIEKKYSYSEQRKKEVKKDVH